jgi:hypothetical protein
MLNANEEARLDSLSRLFRATFRDRLPDAAAIESFDDRLVVTIPAKHPATGDVVVRLDGDEVTISIGSHFHCHFDVHFDEERPLTERERLAAIRAVDFITGFLADGMILRVRREGDSVVAAEVSPLRDIKRPPVAGETDYLWSGPR